MFLVTMCTQGIATVEYETVAGTLDALPSAGVARFDWLGLPVALELMGADLWLVFSDTSSAHPRQLYGARVPGAQDDVVVLDFNRAYFLPCAFTPHATCPIPPRQNRLPLAVSVGEIITHE